MKINAMSLCDGHSCGRLVLEKLGFNVINYIRSEIKPYADFISDKNFPMSRPLGDMTKITEEDIKNIPYKIHILISGTPCQSHSRNGKHGGFEDPRGELFFDFINILKWIRKHNNSDVIFFFENVQMKQESANLISDSLGVEVIKLDSRYFSAQRRLRYYWTNLKVDEVDKSREYDYKNTFEYIEDEEEFISTYAQHEWYTHEEVNDLLKSKPIDYIKGKNEDGFVNIIRSNSFLEYTNGEMRARNATKLGYLIVNDGDTISTSFPNSKTRRGRVGRKKFATLDTGCQQMIYRQKTEEGAGWFRYPTMKELERAQGLPDNYTEGVSITDRKDLIGEGWQIDTIIFLLKNLKPTLIKLDKNN